MSIAQNHAHKTATKHIIIVIDGELIVFGILLSEE